jgi:hypothetical protein
MSFFVVIMLVVASEVVSAATVPERAILHFGGEVREIQQYDESVTGLQKYLRVSGVRKITAQQLTRPHHSNIAREHGYDIFLPRKEWWSRGAALALLAEAVEEAVGDQVVIRNWWRPKPYNADRRVAGAARSDHLSGHAIDIDFHSARSAQRAHRWLEDLGRKNPWLRMSIGSGPRTLHVGIDSPLGSRRWTYAHH